MVRRYDSSYKQTRTVSLINFALSYNIQKTLHSPRKMLLTVEAQEWTERDAKFDRVMEQELPR